MATDSEYPNQYTGKSGCKTYVLAFLLAILSGLLFGLVPVRQVLRSDPWQIIRSGIHKPGGSRRFSLRDVLSGYRSPFALSLVTSSLVAVRGLARSLKATTVFSPRT